MRLEVTLDCHGSGERFRERRRVLDGVLEEEHGTECVDGRSEEGECRDLNGWTCGDSYGAVCGAEVDSDITAQVSIVAGGRSSYGSLRESVDWDDLRLMRRGCDRGLDAAGRRCSRFWVAMFQFRALLAKRSQFASRTGGRQTFFTQSVLLHFAERFDGLEVAALDPSLVAFDFEHGVFVMVEDYGDGLVVVFERSFAGVVLLLSPRMPMSSVAVSTRRMRRSRQ